MFNTLIVEDNASYRESLRALLSERFPCMDIAEAGTGEMALEQFRRLRPQLVFMDITLPDASGLTLTQRIRAGDVPAVVIVLTVHGSPEYAEAARQAGADYFLSKGVASWSDIVALVDEAFPVACH
jgi:DNA-binding NarL/FixJ family response regulator